NGARSAQRQNRRPAHPSTTPPSPLFNPPGRSRAGLGRSSKEIRMAKRSTKRRHAQGVLNVEEFQRDARRQRNLKVLDGGFNPANEGRDTSFVKNVRPKSKGQTAL